MDGYGRRSRARQCVIASVVVFAAWLGVAMPQAFAGDATAGSAGMLIYIDPQTGQLLKGPAPGSIPLQLSPSLRNALSTSHQGLVAVPSSVPGGGVKVDLQGRFLSPLITTIDANGKVGFHHLEDATEASGRSVSGETGSGTIAPGGSTTSRDTSAR